MADYDYIIVGAGSAGGALAARLSENPTNKVLLLEAGAASHPYSRMPLSFGLLIDNPAANWCYQSEPEPGTANRRSRCRAASFWAVPARSTGWSGYAASRSISTHGRRWDVAVGAGATWRRSSRGSRISSMATAATAAAPRGR